MYDVVKGGAAVLAEAFTGVASDIAGVAGLVSDDAAEISRMFADMSRNARGLSDDALADLSRRFGLTSQQATALATATRDAALSARVASGDFKALEQALPKSSIDATIERLSKFGLLLKKDTPEAAAAGAEGINKVGDAAAATAANIERIKIGNLLKQMDELFRSGQAGSDAYKALNAQFLAAEARLNELTGAADKAKQAQDDLANKTDRAAQSMRNYGNAADDASRSADRASSSNSQVADSFGNIGRQSSSPAISLGNLSAAFVQQALAAAGSATSASDYISTWNQFIAQSEDVSRALSDRIELLTRLTAATDEEAQIRARLEQQYGTSSRRLEELVQLELKLAEAKRQRNQESEREIEIEARRAGQAGGIGTQGAPVAAAGTGASAGRGTTAGAGSRIEAPIAITVNGLPSDRETWRQLISDVIMPEIKRIERLSR
ncbi:MAG: hypothetical protein IPO66_16310 [Rhodanobacteraceae bacterium]|nr:hypothetical protein [Rhodanobacteraceae bacterium]